MKTIQVIVMVALIAWGATVSFAQCGDKGERIFGFMRADFNGERLTQKMVAGLSLNEEQATKVGQINDKYAQHFKSIRQNEQLSLTQKVARFKPLLARKNADFQQVLSAEQFEQYTNKRAEIATKHYAKRQAYIAERPSAEERATKRTERMTEHLSLSKKQQKALKKSFIRSTKALDVIMGEADLSPLARAEKAAPILDAQKVATQEILTPEQWNKLRQLRAERCEKRGDNRRGAKKGHFRNIDNPQAFAVEHTKRMSQHLDLDAEQQTAIEAINLDLAKQLQQLKADESERKDKHAKMKAIMDANAAALKEVLNAEQYAKFEEHRQKRGERRAHMRK